MYIYLYMYISDLKVLRNAARVTHCNTLQRTATHTVTRCQHTAPHCNIVRITATSCSTMSTHCNTLQHAATRC